MILTCNLKEENIGCNFKEHDVIGVTYAEVDTVALEVATFTDTGLTANTLYYYRVRAFKN
jgi:hypothetical protein